MTDDVEMRRRRAAFRATHRGTKEMDWMLGRYASAALPRMQATELDLFEEFLTLPDPELEQMITFPQNRPGGRFAAFVEAVRTFNGLGKA